MIASMDKLAKAEEVSRHEQIMLLLDRRLELTVLYAIGDASGPCVHHVKVGVSTRDAFAAEIRKAGVYRSAEVAVRFEAIVSGRGRAEMLKTSLLAALGDRGLAHNSWRLGTDAELHAIVGKLSRTYGVPVMTREEAVALEHRTYEEIAAEIRRGLVGQ